MKCELETRNMLRNSSSAELDSFLINEQLAQEYYLEEEGVSICMTENLRSGAFNYQKENERVQRNIVNILNNKKINGMKKSKK